MRLEMIHIERELKAIKKLLSRSVLIHSKYLDIEDASIFYNIPINTLYYYCSNRMIPYRKQGKKSYFKKSDIETFLYKKGDRFKSTDEMEDKADDLMKDLHV